MDPVTGEQTHDEQLEEISITLEVAKEKVSMARALLRLQNNEYFKQVFVKEYMRDYAVRLVKLKASPATQSPIQQQDIINQIDAIGQLDQFMHFILQQGDLAEKSIIDAEEAQEFLLTEHRED